MPRVTTLTRWIPAGVLSGLVLGLLFVMSPPMTAPASAAARVTVANEFGEAAVDPTYRTTLRLSGSGFQSIAKGHGGIYVQFGAVRGQWRPSKGAVSGHNYFVVPDTETKNNAGYLKFVAFPGSDTASSANGGTLRANGTWSTTINVPGATFQAYDRNGKVTTIDCRKETCGIVTFGAHGVHNANNETFTAVKVKDLYGGQTGQVPGSAEQPGQEPEPAADAEEQPSDSDGPGQPDAPAADESATADVAELTVDRSSAKPGRVMAFSATGLRPGSQVSAVFDDGAAGAGPLTVGTTGQVAGLLQIPSDITPGTYELRLMGDGDLPAVRFAVVAEADVAPVVAERQWQSVVFAAAGGVALIAAIAFAAVRRRGGRGAN